MAPGESIQDRDGQTSCDDWKKYLSYDRVSYDEGKKRTRRMMEVFEYSWCFFFIIPDKKFYAS